MFTLRSKGRLISVEEPVVMGIINVTPDSFYSGSRKSSAEQAIDAAGKMLEDGAFILDIGGQSTAPASSMITAEEEMDRVVPVIEGIKKNFPQAILSIDSFYAAVVGAALHAGADIVNDISGGQIDPEILAVTAREKVPYILMHMRGTPQTMQQFTQYDNLVGDILRYFQEKMDICRNAGIQDVILDPGFCFSKTREQNFELMDKLEAFKVFNRPVLVGISRKSMLYKTLNITPKESLNATTVMNTVALLKGAAILRVHDVKPAVECIKMVRQLSAGPGKNYYF